MGAVKRLITQTLPISKPPSILHLFIRRQTFSSEPPIQIQTVSYPTKPKPEQEPETETEPPIQQPKQTWTPDEMRYMKDSNMPISYPNRVAPLPDDRMGLEDELQKERIMNIQDQRWKDRRVLRFAREDKEDLNLPFPQFIKDDNADQSSKKKKNKIVFDLKEALRLVKAKAKVTFDETLEAHVKMTPDLRRTDLKLSGFVRFPHGFGKTYRVAVFAEGAAADEARDAGADVVGGPELVDDILSGQVKIDFDRCIATPSMMQHVKKLSKNLKQLMPDPKKRTVTNDISRAVKESKEQGVLFKKDKTAIVHVGLGKVSFSEDALRDNIGAFVNALLLAKPAGLKKSSKYAGYVDSFHICSTMGPSFPITIQSLSMAADRYNRLQLGVQSESA